MKRTYQSRRRKNGTSKSLSQKQHYATSSIDKSDLPLKIDKNKINSNNNDDKININRNNPEIIHRYYRRKTSKSPIKKKLTHRLSKK